MNIGPCALLVQNSSWIKICFTETISLWRENRAQTLLKYIFFQFSNILASLFPIIILFCYNPIQQAPWIKLDDSFIPFYNARIASWLYQTSWKRLSKHISFNHFKYLSTCYTDPVDKELTFQWQMPLLSFTVPETEEN